MASKASGFIDWLIPQKTVKLNRDTQLLKLVAMITMLIDHLGAVIFPQYKIFRIIGRMAFPLYAYCLTVGCCYTRDMGKYISRVVLLALISQPIYVVAMKHTNAAMYAVDMAQEPARACLTFYLNSFRSPSILLSLTVGMVAIWSIKERKFAITALVAVGLYFVWGHFDYGWRGVVLMVLFYVFASRPIISVFAVASFMVWWCLQGSGFSFMGVNFSVQGFAILALPLIYIPTKSKIKLPKLVFYIYYPAHLALVLMISRLVK